MEKKERLFRAALTVSENEETAKKYAEHLDELFALLDPAAIGDKYSAAIKNGDWDAAIEYAAAHFRAKPDFRSKCISAARPYDEKTARDSTEGKITVVNIPWDFCGANIDYYFNPTLENGPVNHEWLYQLNRQYFWYDSSAAYRDTGDELYAKAFCTQMRKWIAQTKLTDPWNCPGSAWRTIECGLRLSHSWPIAFDAFKRSENLDDTTLLLMLASMHRQAVHLAEHPKYGNWLMIESGGLYTFSAVFSEFTDAAHHRSIATDRLIRETAGQILPDGMQNELSPDYHLVVHGNAMILVELAQEFGYADEIPVSHMELLYNSAMAAIKLSTPRFTQPRTNDCFTLYTSAFTQRAESILGKTPELSFVNTARKEGRPPVGETASALLPYAGFAVMRSDWSADATYLCFDVGPLGLAHMHQDMLNIHLYKGDCELIFDDGGGQYEISDVRRYAMSAHGHNTVTVDGLGQERTEPKIYKSPIDVGWITNEVFDYAKATYDAGFGTPDNEIASHTREIRFCKPDLFCVSDTLSSKDGKPHDYEILFHLDTTSVRPIPEYKNAYISELGGKYEVAIIPLDSTDFEVSSSAVCGRSGPTVRGWFNGRNAENCHPATTIARKATGAKDFRFNTLLIPLAQGDGIPSVSLNESEVAVKIGDKEYSFNLNELNK